MKLYRAVSDILVSQADPHWQGAGVFGEGTYFRPEYRGITSLTPRGSEPDGEDMRNWELIAEYEANLKTLELRDSNTDGLHSAMLLTFDEDLAKILKVEELESADLTALAKKRGFQAVDIRGADVEGGDQVIIPKGVKPTITLKAFNILCYPKFAKGLEKLLGKPGRSKQRLAEFRDIPAKLGPKVDKIFKEWDE
jgi:hypothetical protein